MSSARVSCPRRIRQLRRQLKAILRQHSGKAPRYKHTRGLARNLLKVWPARRSHLPQTLTRQPIRTRRTHHRTTPLRLHHMLTPETIALRLPHPGPDRPRPPRPSTPPHKPASLERHQILADSQDYVTELVCPAPVSPSATQVASRKHAAARMPGHDARRGTNRDSNVHTATSDRASSSPAHSPPKRSHSSSGQSPAP